MVKETNKSAKDIKKMKEKIEKMSKEELEKIQVKVTPILRGIVDKAVEDANEILNQYGLRSKMQFLIEEIEE